MMFFTALGGVIVYFLTKYFKEREEMKNFMQTPINVTEDDIKAIDAIWEERKKSTPVIDYNIFK